MQVREMMNRRVSSISSSAMVSEAVERMKAVDADALPVVENHRIVGIVTERDIASHTPPGDQNPQTTPIRSVMTSDIVCCSQEDDVEKAIGLLETRHARRLIVLDSRGTPVGVLSAEDLAAKTGEHSHER